MVARWKAHHAATLGFVVLLLAAIPIENALRPDRPWFALFMIVLWILPVAGLVALYRVTFPTVEDMVRQRVTDRARADRAVLRQRWFMTSLPAAMVLFAAYATALPDGWDRPFLNNFPFVVLVILCPLLLLGIGVRIMAFFWARRDGRHS